MPPHTALTPAATQALLVLCLLTISAGRGVARDWYVDNLLGADDSPGTVEAPLQTPNAAVGRAVPGDTIHLVPNPEPYRQMVVFHNKSGEPGNPITIDGHGATLSGSEPLDPATWELVQGGLYRSTTLQPANPAVIGRYYFIFDGIINRMGRSSKGPRAAYSKPEDLQPGEWTWVADEEAFYVRTPGDRPLAECDIAAPMRANGVALSGKCEHLVIRNLTATHVWNDGFNIHGESNDILFENIRAIECGDDGISAHEQCSIEVRGMISIGNSTGACHVNNANSICEDVYIQGCHGFGYYMLNTGTHILRNSIIVCDAAQSVVVAGDVEPPGTCTLKLENVVLLGGEGATALSARARSILEMTHVTALGLSMSIAGDACRLLNSVISGEPGPRITVAAGTQWQANANLYDIASLQIGDMTYAHEQFAAYRAATGQDAGSLWVGPTPAPADAAGF